MSDRDDDVSEPADSLLAQLAAAPSVDPAALAATPRIAMGQRLGRYVVDGEAHAGGMGAVYRARDVELGRPVALKVLTGAAADDRARVLREARSATQVHHPGVVTIFEAGELDGVAFIAMEWLDGESLRTRLRQAPPKATQAIDWLLQIADALAAVHAAGLVHRDLKPDNVMLDAHGHTRLVDFGLAWTPEGGPPGGTPAFMPPELLAGHAEPDARADVFALGLVGYALLGGEVKRDLAGRVVDARLPRAGRRLRGPLARCLRTDPEVRYADAGDAARELRRTATSSRSRAVWIAAAVLLAVGAGAVYSLRPRRAADVPSFIHRRLTASTLDDRVLALALSPDATQLAYVDRTGAHLRAITGGEASLVYGGSVAAVAWSPDGARLALATGDAVRVLTLADRRDVEIARGPYVGVAWSPDGSELAAATTSTLELYSLQDKAARVLAIEPAPRQLASPVFSPDGAQIAYTVVDGEAQDAWVLAVPRAGGPVTTLRHDVRVMQVLGVTGLTWSAKLGLIYAYADPPGREPGSNVHALSADGSELPPLTAFAGVHIASLSAAQRSLAYLRLASQHDVWTLDETPAGWVASAARATTANERPTAIDGTAVTFATDESGPWTARTIERDGTSHVWRDPDEADLIPVLVHAGLPVVWRIPPNGAPTLGRLEARGFRALYASELVHSGRRGFHPGPYRDRLACDGPTGPCMLVRLRDDHLLFEAFDLATGARTPRGRLSENGVLQGALWIERGLFANPSPQGARVESLDGRDGTVWPAPAGCVLTELAWRFPTASLIATAHCTDPRAPDQLLELHPDGTATTLYASRDSQLTNPRVSPDGKRVAFSARAITSDAWLMTEDRR